MTDLPTARKQIKLCYTLRIKLRASATGKQADQEQNDPYDEDDFCSPGGGTRQRAKT
ncbi:hypothetical protein D3C73_1636220 [compost metagenome]